MTTRLHSSDDHDPAIESEATETSTHVGMVTASDDSDPYVLDPSKVMEPPKGWAASLRFFGPGMVASAGIVGSGELITTTTLGSKAGMMLLWLILVSTVVKVAVQIELARWSISTGKPGIFGYDHVPPKIGKRSWASYLVILQFLQFLANLGGIVGASAVAMSMLLPIGGDPFSALSIGIWSWIFTVIVIVIHQLNRYSVIETVSTALVLLVTVAVIVMVFGIQATEFAWTAGDLADGMRFKLSAGAMGIALSMFGLTGVNANEISGYTFWVVEKGYATWTGPNDGSDDWVRRARGWISVMKKDAWVSWFVYTLATVAFYILGATVLYKQGLSPTGIDVIETISRIFTDTLGAWVGPVFLLLSAITLAKTLFTATPNLSRQFAASLAVFGVFDWADAKRRNRVLRTLMVILPVCWGLTATVFQEPLQLVILAGILQAVYLMIIAIATVYLSFTETDKRIRDGAPTMVYLLISAVSIFAVGALAVVDVL
ncbi:Nramp family divalent metal transporter [Propionimicrobium sp. PCR01-08-3]|uniref:Nramp family divalent metal transporter n=1 Tax=Propionimicrobium sp. PCR01-08-3 TaxID=3052086 RepID=UPI00255C3ED1|nr:Nramp family divalent metal transporter [Propionimicrobium sp. PCR01-08-3]WIY83087.1 Nramp family divalent metal transporter [Propionimicrobium sp. PCR01-08-3]